MAAVKKTAKAKIVRPAVKKTDAFSAPLFSFDGQKTETVSLPKELFGQEAGAALLAQVVYAYQANQRQGSAHTKNRGDVNGSRRKIWRQKGTGRARHGDRYSPIFVGGGVAHGPHPRPFTKKTTASMRRKALLGALSQKQKNHQIIIIDGLNKAPLKTKNLFSFFKTNAFTMKQGKLKDSVLLATPSYLPNVYRSGRNIGRVSVKEANLLTAYDVLKHKKIVISKEAIPVLISTFITS